MNWIPTVTVQGWWVPNEKKLNPKTGKPTFFLNVVRKITLKSDKNGYFHFNRDDYTTKHLQISPLRRKGESSFTVTAIVEKNIPHYDRDLSKPCPTVNKKVESCKDISTLINWLSSYIKNGKPAAEDAVRHMLNDEPVIMNPRNDKEAA